MCIYIYTYIYIYICTIHCKNQLQLSFKRQGLLKSKLKFLPILQNVYISKEFHLRLGCHKKGLGAFDKLVLLVRVNLICKSTTLIIDVLPTCAKDGLFQMSGSSKVTTNNLKVANIGNHVSSPEIDDLLHRKHDPIAEKDQENSNPPQHFQHGRLWFSNTTCLGALQQRTLGTPQKTYQQDFPLEFKWKETKKKTLVSFNLWGCNLTGAFTLSVYIPTTFGPEWSPRWPRIGAAPDLLVQSAPSQQLPSSDAFRLLKCGKYTLDSTKQPVPGLIIMFTSTISRKYT